MVLWLLTVGAIGGQARTADDQTGPEGWRIDLLQGIEEVCERARTKVLAREALIHAGIAGSSTMGPPSLAHRKVMTSA